MERGEGQQRHIHWLEYKQYVNKIIDIWDEQSKRYCPKCGHGGRKDNNSTQITCDNCGEEFCYFWEKSFSRVNKPNHNAT